MRFGRLGMAAALALFGAALAAADTERFEPVVQKTPAKKKAKAKAKDKTADEPYEPGGPTFAQAPFVPLDGSRPLPSWLHGIGPAVSDGVGLVRSSLRTVPRNLIESDFVVDLQFKFAPNERSILHAGLGLDAKEAVSSRIHGPGHGGYGTLTIPGQAEKELARFVSAGPHVFRVEKQGDALFLAIGNITDGKFESLGHKKLANLAETAPFLTRTRSSFFVNASGGAVQAMRIVVAGKPLDPETPAASPKIDLGPLATLDAGRSLPLFLQLPEKVEPGDDGVKNTLLRSVEAGLHERDFTADVQLRFREREQSIIHIGLGGSRVGGIAWEDAISSRVHGPGFGGYATLSIPGVGETELGRFVTAGPHLFRIEKRGDVLSLMIGEIEKGEFRPEFRRSILNLKATAPFLTKANASVFAHTGSGTLQAMRLTLDGKTPAVRVASVTPKVVPKVTPMPVGKTPVPTPKTPIAKVEPKAEPKVEPKATPTVVGAMGRENLLPFAPGKLPSFFDWPRDVPFHKGGGLDLDRREYRSARADLMTKDFTFDAIFRVEGNAIAVIGVGPWFRAANGGVMKDSIGVRLHGPAFGSYGDVYVSFGGARRPAPVKYSGAGPHLLRIQKRGDVLSLSVCENFKDTFVATSETVVASLKESAPFFNATNGRLFLAEAGAVEAVRLVVEGEPIETRDHAVALPARASEGSPVYVKLPSPGPWAVDAGPKGMAVTAGGALTWTPTASQLGRHVVRLRSGGAKGATVSLHALDVCSAADARLAGGDLAKVEALYQFPLVTDKAQVSPGLDGKSLLLVDGTRLVRLGGNGVTPIATHTLPAACERIAERADHYVALSDEKKALLLVDKKTLAVTKSIRMDYFRRNDVALHPTKPLSYVAVTASRGGGLSDVFLVVNEATGEVHEPEGLVGTWLAIAPDGKELYAGERSLYGDAISVYTIRETIRPYLRQLKQDPGGNGQGLVLSPDGKRLSYLTFTGYPRNARSIAAWDTRDLDKRPAIYPWGDAGATGRWVAFHPSLPIAAVVDEKRGAVCFDRETGEPLASRVDATYPPLGDVGIRRLWFAPDGRHLLLECEAGSARWLRRVALQLTPAESAKLAK